MRISEQNIRQKIKELDLTFFETSFNFLNGHKSFRPGCLHTFMGRSGEGKSTLMRSILYQLMLDNRVFLWLSEETEMNLMINLFRRIIPESCRDNLIVFSEVDSCIENDQDLYLKINEEIETSGRDILILDNITTSSLYPEDFKKQSLLANRLKKIASCYGIPVIIFAHTRSGVDQNRLLLDEDIRGCKTISNLSDYFYAIQMFCTVENKYQTLRVLKSRYHNNSKDNIFILKYANDINAYESDKEIGFLKFQEIWKERYKLS